MIIPDTVWRQILNEDRSSSSDLHDLLEKVVDEDTFIDFVTALAADFRREREIEAANPSPPYSHGALGWENGTVDAVLEAAAQWARDAKGRWSRTGDGAAWYRCAQILFAGKFYE